MQRSNLAIISVVSAMTVSAALAEDVFWKADVGSYAPDYQCDDESKILRVTSSAITASTLVCENLDSSKTDYGYYLFLQCGEVDGGVIYMGEWTGLVSGSVALQLTEYRGGSGAPDINVILDKCD